MGEKIRNPEQTKKNILAAAEQCFAEKGFYGARIDEIAALSGANKRMIYAYFGNKEDLYVAVLDSVYKRTSEMEMAGIDEEGDCVEAIRGVVRLNFMFLYNNPNVVKIMMWENLNEGKFAESVQLSAIKKPVYNRIRKIIIKGIAEEIFREDTDIESVIFDTIAFCFSYFSNRFTLAQIFETDYYNEEKMNARINHICDCILSYLKR